MTLADFLLPLPSPLKLTKTTGILPNGEERHQPLNRSLLGKLACGDGKDELLQGRRVGIRYVSTIYLENGPTAASTL